MRVLMFGWEFPPHISGGLGTACYGLTKGMTFIPGLDVIFVVPKVFGDEDQDVVTLLGANNMKVTRTETDFEGFLKKIHYIEIGSHIIPYTDPEEYYKLVNADKTGAKQFVHTHFSGNFEFTGGYGPNLFQEIGNYAFVASLIAGEYQFDLIHVHDWLTYPAGVAAKQVSGKSLVVHVHATDFDRSGGKVNPGIYEIEKKGMEAADRIITVSNLTRKTVIEKYGINAEKVFTVYNAVEPLAETEKIQVPRGIREKIVTFLGRITMQKGPEYFIEVAHRILQKMDNVRFVMAGSGDMLTRMIHRAAALRIMDKFHFTGFLKGDDVYRMFSLTDVYVMPSVSEPFGISPLEAMQSNVPVIISRQSGVSEILHHAIKVDFWDIHAMADAIYGILNYEGLASFFKKHGKDEVENLKWENSARKVKEIYDQIIV
ncbi:MAG: 4-alpha-glucanotransferase [Bacteroides sp. SM23_62_1]|nr:MAG: 4-alpha-glucanotransferase [Bacteroides sp. SM23_62_1]